MGPDAIPVGSLTYQELWVLSIQPHEVCIDMEILFCPLGVEEVWRFREKIPLGDSFRKMKKGDEIDVMGIPSFVLLNMLKKTTVDPLESLNKTHGVQSRTKLHKSIQNTLASLRGPKAEDTIGERDGIRRTII